MRKKVKLLAAGIVVAATLVGPLASAAHAVKYVTREACEKGGGSPSAALCIGGKYDGWLLWD